MRDAVAGQLFTSGEVARLLGKSRERIVQLDEELKPSRTASGRRIYTRQSVEAFLARRTGRTAR